MGEGVGGGSRLFVDGILRGSLCWSWSVGFGHGRSGLDEQQNRAAMITFLLGFRPTEKKGIDVPLLSTPLTSAIPSIPFHFHC